MGVRYYDDFSIYAGEFINGIRNGKGTMVWDNNDVRIAYHLISKYSYLYVPTFYIQSSIF